MFTLRFLILWTSIKMSVELPPPQVLCALCGATDLKSMRNWQRWFYEAVRGQPTTGKPLTVRRWNTWITWCSLAMSAWPEGQVAVLAPVAPKEPLRGPEACLAYLWSL